MNPKVEFSEIKYDPNLTPKYSIKVFINDIDAGHLQKFQKHTTWFFSPYPHYYLKYRFVCPDKLPVILKTAKERLVDEINKHFNPKAT